MREAMRWDGRGIQGSGGCHEAAAPGPALREPGADAVGVVRGAFDEPSVGLEAFEHSGGGRSLCDLVPTGSMEQFAFIIAFVLLWAFLGAVAVLVVKVARKADRGDSDGPNSHGL